MFRTLEIIRSFVAFRCAYVWIESDIYIVEMCEPLQRPLYGAVALKCCEIIDTNTVDSEHVPETMN